MRNRNVLTLALAAMLTAACSDFHTSDNGQLDGFWQLANVDTLANNRSGDVRELKIFWAVQADLLEIRDLTNRHLPVFFRFEHRDGQLKLSRPVADNRLISDSLVRDVNTIRYYGFRQLEETFKVLRLDGKAMLLESGHLRLHFRKY